MYIRKYLLPRCKGFVNIEHNRLLYLYNNLFYLLNFTVYKCSTLLLLKECEFFLELSFVVLFRNLFITRRSEWNTSLRTKRNTICNIQKPRCLIAFKWSVEKLGLSQYCMRCLKIYWIMCIRNVPIMLGGGGGHWRLTQQPSHLLGKTNTEKFGDPTVTECLRKVWKWITWHDVVV